MAGPWEDFAPAKTDTKPWEDFAPSAAPSTVLERVGTGVMDPIHGGAQLLTHMLPKGMVDFVNRMNNALADAGAPLARIPEGGVDESIKARETAYEASRAAAGSTGVDWARLAGNVVSPVNLGISRLIPAVAAGATRAALGNIGGGAAMSALNPVAGDDFAGEKAAQAGIGAAAGAVSPFITRAASRVISPAGPVADKVRLLASEGVRMTPGQVAGGTLKRAEDAMVSRPFIGDTIAAGQRASIESFNKAEINRALKPLGEKLPANVRAGHEAINAASDKVSDFYDQLLSRAHGELDPTLQWELNTVRQMGQAGLAPDKAAELSRIIDNEIVNRFPQGGRAAGETVKEIESELGRIARDYGRSENYDTRKIGRAAMELQDSLRNMLERVNPQDAADLKKVNTAYAHLKRAQVAAARAGSKEGLFTPAGLRSAVRELDPSKAKSAYAKGRALDQDLAEAAESVLPSKVNDSGTPTRLFFSDPWKFMGGAAAAIPLSLVYSQPSMTAISKLAELGGTPQARLLSDLIRQGSPFVTAPLVAGANAVQQP